MHDADSVIDFEGLNSHINDFEIGKEEKDTHH
jgi:hypothetical protein